MISFVDFISRRLSEGTNVSRAVREWCVGDSDFVESEHPRNEEGEFTDKGGGKKKRNKKESKQDIPYHDPFTDEGLDNLIDVIEGAKKEGEYWAMGLRGIYEEEEGKTELKKSYETNEEGGVGRQLSGTSTILVVPDWDQAGRKELENGFREALKKVKKYGDRQIAIVVGKYMTNEIMNDPGEGVLGNARVIGYIKRESIGDSVQELSAFRNKSLHKEQIGTVEFMGDIIKVFTVNGQYTRSPYGPDIIEFTMGGNWYGGTREGTYRPICAEDEVVLHELMPPVDILATLVHEVIERWGMKTKGLSYDDAHTDLAEPAERKARKILEGGDWSFEGPLGEQFQTLIERIAA